LATLLDGFKLFISFPCAKLISQIFPTTCADDQSFSQVVAGAKAAGYTEPDPRDDLAGMDVARKVTILARECGLPLELDAVPVRSLVPEPLQSCATAEEYMQRLPDHDGEMAALLAEAEAAGECLRYVGVVDVKAGTGSVELRRYPKDHPFAQLSGSDNIIAFATQRYSAQPLIVRGPGAGAEVTAGGVFSDLLRLAAFLGGPSS
jgi:bifunctional aspartokinase / homoserine dehydrogenase 1